MNRKIWKILSGTVVAAVVRANAAMTPEAFVNQALEHNPELNFYVANIAAAKGAVRTAGTIRNPELNAQAGYKSSRDNTGGTSGNGAAWSVSFSQVFEYPGRIALRKAIASHDVNLAQLHLEQFRRTLAARVRALAYGISSAHGKSTAAGEVAGRFQALKDIIEQRPAAGVTPQLEALLIAANALMFRRQERDAALAETAMAAELNQLRGQPANAPLAVKPAAVRFSRVSLPNLLQAARSHAFDIRIREAELAQQSSKLGLARNERYPAITVGPFYSHERAADTEQQVGLGISLPLPIWDRNAGNIATNKARWHQAQASLTAAERQVERRVSQSAAILEATRSEIENWQTGEVPKFREAAELADQNYRLGAVPLTLYVETQKQYLEILSAVRDLEKDALQAAEELQILTGLNLAGGEPQP